MAVTNEQVLSAISEYVAANGRPCPSNFLVEKFGSATEVLEAIKGLKANGTVLGRRGRTGGLLPQSKVDAAPTESAQIEVVDSTDDVAQQFAALAAKLAADDATASVG